jgi:hypothetical protein
MLGVGADDPHHALAPDDLAVPADLLHGGFDFHRPVLLPAFFIVI